MNGAPLPRLAFVGPAWFALVMGLSGLALAWHRAVPLMGEAAGAVAWAVAALDAAVALALALAFGLRLRRHPEAWAEDRRHPVRHPFVAALPVSLMLLATVAVALWGPTAPARLLWWLGSLGQFVATAWVMARWWRGAPAGDRAAGLAWPGVTPVLFIPVVGNVLAPLAGVPLGHEAWAAAQFGIGVLFWPVVLVLIGVRVAVQGPWPERLKPSVFIVIAPPAVVGLGLLQFGAPVLLAWACWGAALFGLAWAGTQARAIAAMPFALPHWAMSFPLAALAALSLRLAVPGTPFALLALALLALASLLGAALLLATVRGLRDGSLLAPEPVASIQVVQAPAG
ncbi:MAG: C4-dicarboxylate ABC transporter [Betaproteobacteria bacterium]|nr:C4-dicarboxylate ABC transporter [Rubrivivax sp.]